MASNLAIRTDGRNDMVQGNDGSPATPEITDDIRLGLRLLAPHALNIFRAMYKQDERYYPDRVKAVIIVNAPVYSLLIRR